MTAPSTTTTASPASRSLALNAQVAAMHGPTTCLASTMSSLLPFPEVAALPDAGVLDLHVSLAQSSTPSHLDSHTKVRYSTGASASDAADFYKRELAVTTDNVMIALDGPGDPQAHFEAPIGGGRYCASVFDLGHTTTVMVQAESTHDRDHVPLTDLANWHGFGLFPGASVSKAEVFTVASGIGAPVQAIYSTHYCFAAMTCRDLRTMTDLLIERCGWTSTETFKDSLSFQGSFEGEAHISGIDGAARLTLVGEYTLPLPA